MLKEAGLESKQPSVTLCGRTGYTGIISPWIKSQKQYYRAWQIGQAKSDGKTGENPNSLVIIHTSELPCFRTSAREELGKLSGANTANTVFYY